MAKAKKKETLTPEERLQAALVPDWEQPYKVPENWCWIHLLNSFENCTDSKKKIQQKEYLQDGKIAVVDQGQDLVGGYTNDREMTFAGNLPVIIFGDHTRCIKYIDFPFAQGADGVKVLKPKLYFNTKAFYYAFQTVDIPNMGYRRHFPLFDQYAIPVPPLPEQQRIVDRVESLFAKLDEAKQRAQDALDNFETRKAAILHKAFTGELTAGWRKEHSVGMESWNYSRFEDCILKMQNGLAKRSGSSGAPFVVLRLANLSDDGFITDDLREILLDEKEQKNYILKDNDVLMIRVNGSKDNVGKQFLFSNKQPWAFCDHIIRITYRKAISPKYMVYFSKSDIYRRYIDDNMVSSAGQNTISRKGMASLLTPLPLLGEQAEIVRILDGLLDKGQQAKETAEAVLEQIDLIKKSILARAFRGELGTNDPAEESAVELIRQALEKSDEVISEPKVKVKRVVIPVEIKSMLSNSTEEEIIRVLMKSAPEAVSIQTIMSISKKKFELMDALRNLEKKQLVIRTDAGEYLLTR